MSRLYFKYGAMGSSKTAQALMCKFNYEQQGFNVLLMKSELDDRDKDEKGNIVVKSRVGIGSACATFSPKDNIFEYLKKNNRLGNKDVLIVDECQFCTKEQINQLKEVTGYIPVLCYGLKTNFKTELFEGSKRLLEIADSIAEIKSVCKCGRKSTINARWVNGKIVTDGDEVVIGGDSTYTGMCYDCFIKQLKAQKEN